MKQFTNTLFAALFILVLSVNGQEVLGQKEELNEVDEFIQEQMQNNHVPGLSAAIIVGDSIVWYNSYGYLNLEDSIPVNDSTLFNVFSIGKSITAACAMQIWDDGLLGLDENVNGFLPFQIDNPYIEPDSITVRMLMCHTSAISDYGIEDLILPGDPTISLGYYLENYLSVGGEYYHSQNFYNSQPGLHFHYSTHGPALTGFLVEELTGIDFHLYAKDSLLTPLEMSRSTWFLSELNIDNLAIGYKYQGGSFIPRPHRGHPAYPGFFLRSNALELANFTIMLLNHGEFQGQSILSNAAIDSMTTIQNPSWGFSYGTTGLALFQRDDFGNRIVWGHNGGSIGGYAAQFYFCKEENSGVVLTTNSEQYLDELVEYMFDYALTITNISEELECRNAKMSVYPNPSTGITNIKFSLALEGEASLSIRNISGQEIKHIPLSIIKNGNYELNCTDFSPGIYFITLQTETGITTEKLIIE